MKVHCILLGLTSWEEQKSVGLTSRGVVNCQSTDFVSIKRHNILMIYESIEKYYQNYDRYRL